MKFENKIQELKIKLPEAKPPVGSYVATKIIGNLLFISGQISIAENGELIKGKIGKDLSTDEGYKAAERCAINIIAQAKKRAKSLPIFFPNQGQKITIGMPAKPTNNQTYISVASKPDVSLAMAEIKVPKITYPKPYKPYEIEIKEKLKLFL